MKVTLTFKTPDVVEYCIQDWLEHNDIRNEDEREEINQQLLGLCGKFVKYGEIVTIEISNEDGEITAKVLEV